MTAQAVLVQKFKEWEISHLQKGLTTPFNLSAFTVPAAEGNAKSTPVHSGTASFPTWRLSVQSGGKFSGKAVVTPALTSCQLVCVEVSVTFLKKKGSILTLRPRQTIETAVLEHAGQST